MRAHSVRLAAWSGACIVVSLAMLLIRPDGFWTMNAGWCAVNLIIVALGWKPKRPSEVRPTREFLALNLGLNVGYIGVGVAMSVLGSGDVRFAGLAVALQGAVLLGLDGYLFGRLPKG